MRIRLWIPAIMLAMITILSSCVPSTKITADEAKNIALQEANITTDTAQGLTARLEREDGKVFYEVDFYVDAVEYDVEVDAVTGEILKFDREGNAVVTTDAPTEASTTLTPEQVQQIALNNAGFSADRVQRLNVHLDHNDGKQHYDVTFVKDDKEYEYEIDAETGAIISIDTDSTAHD